MNTPLSPRRAAVLSAWLGGVAGCTGDIASPGAAPGAPAGAESDGAPSPVAGAKAAGGATPAAGATPSHPSTNEPVPLPAGLRSRCGSADVRGTTNPAVRRLSRAELVNTVAALLGPALAKDSVVFDELQGLPDDDLTRAANELNPNHPPEYAAVLMAVAERAMAILAGNAAERARVFGACANASPVTEDCARGFVSGFGLKAFRRPLSDAEVARYLRVFTSSGGDRTGLLGVLFVLLQAPPLAFHLELGTAEAGGRVRLSDDEVASRLSYMTAQRPPDDLLLQAAGRPGELQALAKVTEHVSRLLAPSSSVARERVRAFFGFYGGLSLIEEPNAFAAKAAKVATAGLTTIMAREAFEFAEHVFWTKNGIFAELMSSRASFPRGVALRTILGAAAAVAADNNPVDAGDGHVGFLHRPALLASERPRTSPIIRGAHVRKYFLCDTLPEPPQDLVNDVLEQLGDVEAQNNRARTTQMTSHAACVACHDQINPLGYAFEGFDQLGARRTRETAYRETGAVIDVFPIDTRVTNPRIERDESPSTSVADSKEMALLIGKGFKGPACFAQRAFEFVRAREYDPARDGCALRDAEAVAHVGSLRDVMVRAIANEDVFWRKP
jgi:hypothetical protein